MIWRCVFSVALLGAMAAALPTLPAPAAAQQAGAEGSGELFFTVLHTSDEHSTLLPAPFVDYHPHDPGPTAGGFARLASAVEAVREARAEDGEPVLLTSAGDYLTGSAFAWLALAGEAPELRLMLELGYDVVILGNHEFDFGSERLAGYLAAAGYPEAAGRTALVAANTRPPPGHPLGSMGIQAFHLETLANGLRVGFIGLLGEGAARFAPAAAPVEFADAHEVASAAVAELRAAGADVVVAITHSGVAEDRALARAVPGIDLILGGHDHVLLEEPLVEAGTLIVHPGAHLQQLLRLEFAFDPASGTLRLRNDETGAPFIVPLDASVPESPWMAARVAGYRSRLEAQIAELSGGLIASLDEPVARSAFTLAAGPPLTETGLGNFVADAVRTIAEAATGERVDFAFQANGLIRGDLVPGTTPRSLHDVSAYDLTRVVGMGFGPDSLPGYPLVSVWLTGAEVRNVLEISVLLSGMMGNSYFLQASGLRSRYDPRRAILAHIPIRGTPIPSGRAVLSAERFTEAGYVPLARGDEGLYHVVTDRYVVSFLPMVGNILPRFAIVPKDREGRPLDDVDEGIIRRDSRELKIWQAVLEYAAAQPRGDDGVPWVAGIYAAPADRLQQASAAPLWLWPVAVPALLLALGGAAFAARRRRRKVA